MNRYCDILDCKHKGKVGSFLMEVARLKRDEKGTVQSENGKK